jgi:hypothetical protein
MRAPASNSSSASALRWYHIAKSREDGMREAAKHYEENMKMFGELRLVRALTNEQISAMRGHKTRPPSSPLRAGPRRSYGS